MAQVTNREILSALNTMDTRIEGRIIEFEKRMLFIEAQTTKNTTNISALAELKPSLDKINGTVQDLDKKIYTFTKILYFIYVILGLIITVFALYYNKMEAEEQRKANNKSVASIYFIENNNVHASNECYNTYIDT